MNRTDAEAGRVGQLRWGLFAWVLPALIVLAAQGRILTYASGQDPSSYILQAQRLLMRGLTLDAFLDQASWFLPGFPFLLALSIRVFGVFSPYWVNLVLLILSLVLLAHLLRSLSGRADVALTQLWVTIFFLFAGYSLNAHFLLYPFRSTVEILFILLSFSAAVRARKANVYRSQLGWGLASSLSVVIGVLCRETVLCAVPAVLVYLWIFDDRKTRPWPVFAAFLFPLLLGLLGVVFLVVSHVGTSSHMWNVWWISLTQASPEGLDLRSNAVLLLGMVRQNLGWPGVFLVLLGSVQMLRSRWRAAWSLFVLPAFFMFAIYSVFLAHFRYALSISFWLFPFAGAGVWSLFEGCLFVCRRAGVPMFVQRALRPAGWLLLLMATAFTVMDLGLWNAPRVTRSQVENLLNTLGTKLSPKDYVWVDGQSRFLIEVLNAYSPYHPVVVSNHRMLSSFYQPSFFIQPETQTYWKPFGIRARDMLEQAVNLSPVATGEQELSLGNIHFSLQGLTPWTKKELNLSVRAEQAVGGVFWLDFRSVPGPVFISLAGQDRTWGPLSSPGLLPIAWPEGPSGSLECVIRSETPLPETLITEPIDHKGLAYFRLNQGRRPSIMNWVAGPVQRGGVHEKWGAVFSDQACFHFPMPLGGEEVVLSVILEPRYAQDRQAVFTYREGEKELEAFTNRLSQARIEHRWSVPVFKGESPEGPREIRLDVRTDGPLDNHFRIVYLGEAVR